VVQPKTTDLLEVQGCVALLLAQHSRVLVRRALDFAAKLPTTTSVSVTSVFAAEKIKGGVSGTFFV
jgi:hypothetical protein